MATTKYRIPIPLNSELKKVLEEISEKNELSLSQTIVMFLKQGLQSAEDDILGSLADSLDDQVTSYTSHEDFWAKIEG